MTKEHLKIVIIIIIIILLIVTRAWIFILDTVINLVKRVFKIGNPSTHKWNIKRNDKKWCTRLTITRP